MAQPPPPDPWDWPVTTVVQYLCNSPGPLFPAFKDSLDRDDLARKIEANDLSGEFLLELDNAAVKEHLGIASFGIVVAFRRIVQSLRNLSHKWQLQNATTGMSLGQSFSPAASVSTPGISLAQSFSPAASVSTPGNPQDVAATTFTPAGSSINSEDPQANTSRRVPLSVQSQSNVPRRATLVPVTNEPINPEEPLSNATTTDEFDFLNHWKDMSGDELLPSLGNSEQDSESESEDDDEDSDTSEGDDSEIVEDGNDNDRNESNEDTSDDVIAMDIDETDAKPATTGSPSINIHESTSSYDESDSEDIDLTPKEVLIRKAENQQLARWTSKKLPKLQFKAYQIWSSAKPRDVIRAFEENSLQRLQQRLKKLEKALIDTATEGDLENLVQHLEPTVHDIAATEWKIQLLSQSAAPEKPPTSPVNAKAQVRKKRRVNKDLDEEDLTSDDDAPSLLDDFVVHDDQAMIPEVSLKNSITDTNAELSTGLNEAGSKQVPTDQAQAKRNVHLPAFWDIAAWRRRTSTAWGDHLARDDKPRHFLGWTIARTTEDWEKAEWFVRSRPLGSIPTDKVEAAMIHLKRSALPFQEPIPGHSLQESNAICQVTMWYICYNGMRPFTVNDLTPTGISSFLNPAQSSLSSKVRHFASFWETIRQIDSHWDDFVATRQENQLEQIDIPTVSLEFFAPLTIPSQLSLPILPSSKPVEDKASEDDEDGNNDSRRPRKRKIVESSASDDELLLLQQTKAEKRVKKDKLAESQRAQAAARLDQHTRNAKLVQKPALDADGIQNVYINPGAQDEKDLIPINDSLKGYLKSNQKLGIAFMWREVVEAGEGALLAHTMGLGKTLQCITLLSTIAEAAIDPTFQSLIPQGLRPMKALVAAPAALIDNWRDEFNKWTPRVPRSDPFNPQPYFLGHIWVIASRMNAKERATCMDIWFKSKYSEVLVISYSILSRMMSGKDYQEPEKGKIQNMLQNGPDIVIADEAQCLKSSKSQISKHMAMFATPRRIALTGSPLSNNLEEYFALLNWACAGFLGPEPEFRAIHANPIKHGLYNDSTPTEYRRALVKLRALEKILEPKVDRAGWEDFPDMPQKTEFTLHLPPTDLQMRIYDELVGMISNERTTDNPIAVMTHFNALKVLSFHPACFKTKLLKDQELLQKMSTQIVDEDDNSTSQIAEEGNNVPSHTNVQAALDDSLSTTSASTGAQALTQNAQLEDDGILANDLDQLDGDRKDPFLSLERIEKFLQYFSDNQILQSSKLSMVSKIVQHCQDEKVLVFSHSLIILDLIEDNLKSQGVRCRRIDGSSGSVDKRQAIAKAFNENPNFAKVMLISTRAGGVGLNLYAASRVIICDESWNPTNERQAIGRAYRLGQQKHVFVYRLMLSGSYEEVLQNQAVFKEQLASRVVEKKAPARYAVKDFGKFLRPLAIKQQAPLAEFRGKDTKVLDKIFDNERIIRIQMGEEFTRERRDQLTAIEEGEVNMILDRLRQTKNPAMTASIPLPAQVPAVSAYAASTQRPPSHLERTVFLPPGATYKPLSEQSIQNMWDEYNAKRPAVPPIPNPKNRKLPPDTQKFHPFPITERAQFAYLQPSGAITPEYVTAPSNLGAYTGRPVPLLVSGLPGPPEPPAGGGKRNLRTTSVLQSGFIPPPLPANYPHAQDSTTTSKIPQNSQSSSSQGQIQPPTSDTEPLQSAREPEVIDLMDIETTTEDDVAKKAVNSIERSDNNVLANRPVSVSSDSTPEIRAPQSHDAEYHRRQKALLEAQNEPVSQRNRSMQARKGFDP